MPIHAVKFKIKKSNNAEGTKKELKIISIYSLGIEPHISVNRCPIRSIHPQKYPWVPPSKHPIIVPVMAMEIPNIIDTRSPYTNLAKTSRPRSSVPR